MIVADRAERIKTLVVAREPQDVLEALTKLSDDTEAPAPKPRDLAQVWTRVNAETQGRVIKSLVRVYGTTVQMVALQDNGGLPIDLLVIDDHGGDRDQQACTAMGIQPIHARWAAHWLHGRKITHPIVPLIQTWVLVRPRRVEPFRPKVRASLPRFGNVTAGEARTLTQAGEPGTLGGKGKAASETLPLDPEMEVVSSCPSWLAEMFSRATRGRTIRHGMPWAFSLVIGALLHTPINVRDGRETTVTGLDLDEVIAWIHANRWGSRAAQWGVLEAAFDEMASYRITVAGYRYWVAIGESLPTRYRRGATVEFRTRVPASAAYGTRLDWPTLIYYRASALMTRAYLSTRALLDRSARKGNDITLYHVGRDGRWQKNPVARYAPLLPHSDVAKFIGMANNKNNRHAARSALQRLQADGEIDIVEERRGYRVYGVHHRWKATRKCIISKPPAHSKETPAHSKQTIPA